MVEDGTTVYGSEKSFTTKKEATATVSTAAVSNLSATTATLNGSFSGATGTIYDRGFYYKKSSESNWTQVGLNSTTGTSGSFSTNVSGLSEGTSYQVKAYVTEWDEDQNKYVDKEGSVVTFTTQTSGSVTPTYLSDFGMPDVSGILSGTGTSGTYSSRGDHWFRYNTTSSNRQIAVHTYENSTYGETVNYVVLYDATTYAPVWTAHTMNNTYWPDDDSGRTSSWTSDPAISLTQISGLDDNSTYSRGHLVASDYRQTSDYQNAQTFYYTNKAPQYQNGFNGGVWNTLEKRVKTMTPSGSSSMLYVITGVLYEDDAYTPNSIPKTLPSGNKNVPIPSHFYKCIMKCTLNGSGTVTAAQGIAFVYTNVSHTGESYYSSQYVTSIAAIQQRAGFDFFAAVPDNLESSAESNTNHSWFTGVSN